MDKKNFCKEHIIYPSPKYSYHMPTEIKIAVRQPSPEVFTDPEDKLLNMLAEESMGYTQLTFRLEYNFEVDSTPVYREV